jgi:hypothetical protein
MASNNFLVIASPHENQTSQIFSARRHDIAHEFLQASSMQ